MKIEVTDECIDQIIVNEAKDILEGRWCYGGDAEIKKKTKEWAELSLWLYGPADD